MAPALTIWPTGGGGSGFLNRVHARLAGFARPATGFVSRPEPKTVGRFARGRQLIAGHFLFAGHLVEAPGQSIWDLGAPDAAFEAERHGFTWLDDLAAVGDLKARARAQPWTWDWIARFGDGQGPGWTPDLVARRVMRWTHHALFLLRGQDKAASDAFYAALTRQATFLARRWRSARAGLPRIEALAGLIYCGLALEGMEGRTDPALSALTDECARSIGPRGEIASRNPEELLEIFTLLTWVAQALTDAGRPTPPVVDQALHRIAPVLRALRHADGGLARFHGGGRGLDGRLDQALAASAVRDRPDDGLQMGFARLGGGRTSLIVDVAPPPTGDGGHASTLAFELTSGRRPVVVTMGPGHTFGTDWQARAREAEAHAALCVAGRGPAIVPGAQGSLVAPPRRVQVERSILPDGIKLEAAHDGFRATLGLTHARSLSLTRDGRGLVGEDILVALTEEDQRLFDRALDSDGLKGVPVAVHFPLHPDVDAEVDMGGAAVSLALKSGEIWVFRQDGRAELSLDPTTYLEQGRLRPRTSQRIVLRTRLARARTRLRWSLSKAHDTPAGVRDHAAEEGTEGVLHPGGD